MVGTACLDHFTVELIEWPMAVTRFPSIPAPILVVNLFS